MLENFSGTIKLCIKAIPYWTVFIIRTELTINWPYKDHLHYNDVQHATVQT